ncbi:unnamed protein product [Orchesella dallaii]|uniref:Uncharacterized protein n=1 Tax=Orchesella dallaii TaxID=48710 RepID=A0ABP1R442_9HEXA
MSYSEPPSWEERVVETREKPGKAFFLTSSIDNEIIFTTTTTQGILLKKEYNELGNFTTDLNSLFITASINARIILTFPVNPDDQITATLKYHDDDNYQLHLPVEISNIYGFATNTFDNGEFNSIETIQTEKLENIPKDKSWMILRKKLTKQAVYLTQMTDPVLKTILSNIVLASTIAGFDISMEIEESKRIVEYEILPDDATMQLSKFLNRYLGLEEDTVLSGSQSFLVPPEIIDPFALTYISRKDFINASSIQKVIINSNCLEESVIFDSKKLNCIAVLDREIGSGKRTHNPSKLVYYPATKSVLSYINIKLVDDYGSCIISQEKPSCAILHFRKSLF